MTHDQLQAKCFQWAHNTFPVIRGQLFAVQNETRPYPGESKQSHLARISHNKSIGVQKGAMDLFLFCAALDTTYTTGYEEDGQYVEYHSGTYVPPACYAFDAKIGKDHLSDAQLAFIQHLRACGGDGWEFRDEQSFRTIFISIMQKHYGTDTETSKILRGVLEGR